MKLLSRYSACACAVALMAVTPAWAQAPAANPFTAIVRASWDGVKKNIAASAAALPEADYGFKPTPAVRSFGQIVGHLVNDHYMMCSGAKGEKNPHENTDFEKTTSKADLVKALEASNAYCDAVYGAMTDAVALTKVEDQYTKLGLLQLNVTHDSEHYGNFITYLRMKGIVPPSSAAAQ